MKNILLHIMVFFVLTSCTGFREKAGLVKYQPDEYQSVTNPPLSVPPHFDVLSPEEMAAKKQEQNKQHSDKELSKGENDILKNIN
jgi:hypothetical protein